MNSAPPKHVIVVGAGFAGITAVLGMAKSKSLNITLIDRRNFHLFQPLLYQVALSGLSPADITVPLRSMLKDHSNVDVILAEAENIDLEKCGVNFDNKWVYGDYLIIACGAKHSYFGNNSWEEFAPGLKNIEQALELRRRILLSFELANKEDNPIKRKRILRFVVIGAGPTGVELAGAIAEIAKIVLAKEFKSINLKETEIYLVESGPKILSAFPEKLSTIAQKDLESMGVKVLLNTKASDLSDGGLKLNGEFVDCRTMIWAAGVRPSSIASLIDSPKDSSGRIIVDEYLNLPNHHNIFALGDTASFKDPRTSTALPGIAPVAMQQGRHAAISILNDVIKSPRKKFEYQDKGIMATIGRSKAVVKIGNLLISGRMAWLLWVFVHVFSLMKNKNKVFVFASWIWAYFAVGNAARIITHKTWKIYSNQKIDLN